MRDGKVCYGIIGGGVVGPWHGAAIQAVENAKLVAVADVIEERAKKLAEQYGADWYSDYRKLLERKDVDVVTICVPSGMHAEVGITAAKAGKHILCEKPLDVTLEKIDRFIQAAKENKVKLGAIFQRRFQPNAKRVKAAIESGKVGKLLICDAYLKYYRSQEYYDSGAWRGTWELDGGGCLMNQGIHGIDLLQWLAGPIKSVYAYAETMAHERIEVEDVAVAVVEFLNGSKGVIEGSTAAYPGFPTTIEVHGTLGSVGLEEDKLTIWRFLEETEEDKQMLKVANPPRPPVDTSDPIAMLGALGESHRPQFEDMTQAVLEDRQPACTGEDARHAVEIILAIYKSAREGRKVKLPL